MVAAVVFPSATVSSTVTGPCIPAEVPVKVPEMPELSASGLFWGLLVQPAMPKSIANASPVLIMDFFIVGSSFYYFGAVKG